MGARRARRVRAAATPTSSGRKAADLWHGRQCRREKQWWLRVDSITAQRAGTRPHGSPQGQARARRSNPDLKRPQGRRSVAWTPVSSGKFNGGYGWTRTTDLSIMSEPHNNHLSQVAA